MKHIYNIYFVVFEVRVKQIWHFHVFSYFSISSLIQIFPSLFFHFRLLFLILLFIAFPLQFFLFWLVANLHYVALSFVFVVILLCFFVFYVSLPMMLSLFYLPFCILICSVYFCTLWFDDLTAEWSRGKNDGLLHWRPGFKPRMRSPRIFKIGFHQQKLSIACNVKLQGALYSVFYAEASKRPWTSLN